ncbi:hypothetical protein M9H77_07666 [Catharanthus roseus]|uniref:Uncharacterized protein n=1 Tax=Catharanthus roseus TaxID=4058 RepID=A0ACC0BVQ1_CATRO|nr:hypothetical protein M9H77_07666 [Catharanthus roseus]
MEDDRSWMCRRTVPGVMGINSDPGTTNELWCLCTKCKNSKYLKEYDVKLHLYKLGFLPNYHNWTAHGELSDHFLSLTKSDMEQPVNASNNECFKCISWVLSKHKQQRPCLWFRLTVCSHYYGVFGWQWQLYVFGSFSIFCGKPRGLYRLGEEVVGVHAAGIGEVCQLLDIIRISVWRTSGFGTHSLPSFSAAG